MATVSEMVRHPAAALEAFTYEVLRKAGSDDDIAKIVAAHLLRANLSGHDSHGVIRIPGYLQAIELGQLKPNSRPTIVRERSVGAVMDAHRGFGHFSTRFAMDWAIDRARQHGIAAVTLRQSHHIGRLGEYTEHATANGMIGIVTVGFAGPNLGFVVPFHGKRKFLGTNPWSMGFPVSEGTPMIYDAATSSIAEGKIRVARSKGALVPPGTLADPDGNPTQDPNKEGALFPLGGELFGHKGFGLGLAAALIGGLSIIDDPMPERPSTSLTPLKERKGMMAGVFLIAIDPEMFGPAARYKELVHDTLTAVRAEAPAPGFSEVIAAGEPEARLREERRRDGVDIPQSVWKQLQTVSEQLGVKL